MSTIPASNDNSSTWPSPNSAPSQALPQWLTTALTRDYLPQMDPFLDWLRQPLGWFALAAVASCMLGIYISPIGWSITAGLLSVIAAGLAFPWLAVRWTRCVIQPQTCELHEGEAGQLLLTVRNPLPVPLFGLTVERFLVDPDYNSNASIDDAPLADVGLAQVDWLSQASFQLPICPQHRGRYPLTTPTLACSFPFGIWTARRPIQFAERVSVHPRRVSLSGMFDCVGRTNGDTGLGNRTGGHGDLIGVREYRRGDSMRTIHWAQTAKLNSIVVCERAAPERTTWQIQLDCRQVMGHRQLARENLAWRVRIAASLASLLSHQSIPFQLLIPGEDGWSRETSAVGSRPQYGQGLRAALERLTDVPLDGIDSALPAHESPLPSIDHQPNPSSTVVRISPLQERTTDDRKAPDQIDQLHAVRYVEVSMQQTSASTRSLETSQTLVIDLDADVTVQLGNWLRHIEQGVAQ